jgi:hypothetical protein
LNVVSLFAFGWIVVSQKKLSTTFLKKLSSTLLLPVDTILIEQELNLVEENIMAEGLVNMVEDHIVVEDVEEEVVGVLATYSALSSLPMLDRLLLLLRVPLSLLELLSTHTSVQRRARQAETMKLTNMPKK